MLDQFILFFFSNAEFARQQQEAIRKAFEEQAAQEAAKAKSDADREATEALKRAVIAEYDDIETTDSDASSEEEPPQSGDKHKPTTEKQVQKTRKVATAAELAMCMLR